MWGRRERTRQEEGEGEDRRAKKLSTSGIVPPPRPIFGHSLFSSLANLNIVMCSMLVQTKQL